jgi:hypothetical protein
MTTTNLRTLIGCAAVLSAAGCSKEHFNIIDTNSPTAEELTGNPTKLILGRAALGVAQTLLNDVGGEISTWGTFGREGYNLLGNDPRLTNEMVRGPLDPGGVGGGQWVGKFVALRSVNAYLAGIDAASDMTTAEKAASKGYGQTIKAILLHRLILRNPGLGIPVDVEVGLESPPAPFVTATNAFARIVTLLDEARTNLQAGGAAFPFTMPPGYAGFDTPAAFAQFNRGYYAKVQAHRATFLGAGATAYQLAVTALGQSFVNPAGNLNAGVYYAYSSASGEPGNPVAEPASAVRFYIHHSLETQAQLKGNGQKDDRFTRKTTPVAERTQNSLTEYLKPVMYNVPGTFAADLDADIPLLKNEELVLLRAEARWFTGDKTGALADINAVRATSGGLPATSLTTGSSDAAFVTELIYNRRYSLLWEQATSWHDARRFNRKGDLPQDRPTDLIFDDQTIPAGECDARSLQVPCTPPKT